MSIASVLKKFFSKQIASQKNEPLYHFPVKQRTIDAQMIDAAAHTEETAEYWRYATNAGANEVLDDATRQRTNARCRYEYMNDGYAFGAARNKMVHTVGRGAALELGNKDHHQVVEKRFDLWCRKTRFWKTLRLGVKMILADGAFFMRLVFDPHIKETCLNVVEIDPNRIGTPQHLMTDKNVYGGIKFDEYRHPITYFIRRQPLNAYTVTYADDYEAVPAGQIIHFYEKDMPEQIREFPKMQSILRELRSLRLYKYAVVDAAENAAAISGVLESEVDSDAAAKPLKPFTEIDIPRGSMLSVQNGKFSQVRAEQPTATHAEFVTSQLTGIGAGIGQPRNVVAADSSQYNYASGRLDHQTFFRSIEVDLDDIESEVIDPVFNVWLICDAPFSAESRKLLEEYDGDPESVPRDWLWDEPEHVDPYKEANATKIGLENGSVTLQDVYARKGQDWKAKIRQRALEKKMLDGIDDENIEDE